MLAKFKLIPYSVRIRKLKTKSFFPLDEIQSEMGIIDFFEFFDFFCNKHATSVYNLKSQKRTFTTEIAESNSKKRFIYGTIKSGEYGISTDFYDIDAKKIIPKYRLPSHSEHYPFHFFFYSPLGNIRNMGLLLLQTIENKGVKTVLHQNIRTWMEKRDKTLIVDISPMISTELLDKLEKSDRILEMRFIRKQIPREITSKLEIRNYKDIIEERSFKVKRNKSIQLTEWIKKLFKDTKETLEFKSPYLEILDEQYENVKIVFETNGIKSTLDLDKLSLREQQELQEKRIKIKDGFPTMESTHPIALNYINQILKKYDANSYLRRE